MFLKKPPKRCTFFVKMVTFPLFNKLYARFCVSFALYFVISHVKFETSLINIIKVRKKHEKVLRIMRRNVCGYGFHKL